MIAMNGKVVVRRFEPARDAPALRTFLIEHQNFHREIEPSWPSGEAVAATYVHYLETVCAAQNGCIFMAECDEQPAGFICVVASMRGESPDDPAPFAWVHEVFVTAEYRRRGVGRELMAEAERFALAEGAHVLRLGVLDRNDNARALYATLGFREHAHVMTKALDRAADQRDTPSGP